MKMAAFHWMGTYYVWNVTLFVLKQRAEELGMSIHSRPLHSVLFPSPPLSYPSAWQGRLLPVKTLPVQLVTQIGFTTCRLHYAHPLRKDLFSHTTSWPYCISGWGLWPRWVQNLCFLKTRRRTKSPPLPGGISKNDPVGAAGKRLSILLLHEAKKWFHIIRWKPPPSQHCFCRRFSRATSLSGCLPPSPSTLLGKSVEAECTGSFCSSCWKKLTYYSFSASNGFYWLTALTIFFSSSLARWNWQCLESYSAPEFGQFNFFLSLKWIVSQCGFGQSGWARITKQSKEWLS